MSGALENGSSDLSGEAPARGLIRSPLPRPDPVRSGTQISLIAARMPGFVYRGSPAHQLGVRPAENYIPSTDRPQSEDLRVRRTS